MASYMGYTPSKDIPSLAGKVILLTGGTGGVGKTAVLNLAQHSPSHIYFTGRNQTAADEVLSQIPKDVKATFLQCDLASLSSVREAAEKFTENRLDIFIANAGIMAVPAALTKDGYEIQFGTNHIGNAALLFRLLPVMLKTAALPSSDVRFISLTSQGYAGHPSTGIDFATLRTTQENMRLGSWGRYGQSKLANILLAKEVGRRYPQILSVAVHPGVVKTDLVNNLTFWKRALVFVTNPRLMSPDQGSFNTLWAATGGEVRELAKKGREEGGAAFYEPIGKVTRGDGMCWDEKLARELWEWTEGVVGVKV